MGYSINKNHRQDMLSVALEKIIFGERQPGRERLVRNVTEWGIPLREVNQKEIWLLVSTPGGRNGEPKS